MSICNSEIPKNKIEAFCQANGIRRLALFGSAIRDDFRPDSDIDILVEFHPSAHIGLAFIRLQDELSSIFGRKVDLNTPGSISKYFRDKVINESEILYDAA